MNSHIIEEANIKVEMIEPRRGPGGHWNRYKATYKDLDKVGYGQTALEAKRDLKEQVK